MTGQHIHEGLIGDKYDGFEGSQIHRAVGWRDDIKVIIHRWQTIEYIKININVRKDRMGGNRVGLPWDQRNAIQIIIVGRSWTNAIGCLGTRSQRHQCMAAVVIGLKTIPGGGCHAVVIGDKRQKDASVGLSNMNRRHLVGEGRINWSR